MRRKFFALLLVVAMLASSIIALPVSAATGSESVATAVIPAGWDNQLNFTQGYSGKVTVSFTIHPSSTDNLEALDLYLAPSGADRGSAKPYLQVTGSGSTYGQGATKVGSLIWDADNAIIWEYDTAAGSYTVSINGTVSETVSCGAQTDVGALAVKTRTGRTATVSNLTVTGDVGGGTVTPPSAPGELNVPAGSESDMSFPTPYVGELKISFKTVANDGSNAFVYLTKSSGGSEGDNIFFQAQGYKVFAQAAERAGDLATDGSETLVEIFYITGADTYTMKIDGVEYGPYTMSRPMTDISGIWVKNRTNASAGFQLKDITVDVISDTVVIPSLSDKLSDMTVGAGGEQEAWVETPLTGDVKISFDMTANNGGNAFIYFPNSTRSVDNSVNLQVQGTKIWAQAAHTGGSVAPGQSTHVEIYYNTSATTYVIYHNGAKFGPFDIGQALNDIAGIWVKNRNNTTAEIVLKNIKFENATEPDEIPGSGEEGPYEYDNTQFNLPKLTDAGVTFPVLGANPDYKKGDVALGGDFKGTGEDPINIEFDMTITNDYTGGTIGYGDSMYEDNIGHWSDMVCMLQFNSPTDGGGLNVRDGGDYVYTSYDWAVGTSHFKLTIDTKLQKYSVWYTAPGAAEPVQVADSIAFRPDTAGITDAIGLLFFEGGAGEAGATITNHKVYGEGYGYVAPKEAKVIEAVRTEPATLSVGPNGKYATLSKALANAIAGDVIEIDAAGDYLGMDSNAFIGIDDLTIRGVNGTPVMGYADRSCSVPVTASKGIWVVSGKNLTVENIKFQNAHDAFEQHGNNYAGIRLEPTANSTITIKNCSFTNNDNGMLVGAAEGMTVRMVNCEFFDNGFGWVNGQSYWSSQEHGMYMGMIDTFIFERSISRQIKAQGHLVKTRAANNYILYSYIAEETTNYTSPGTGDSHISNSNIDIPEGGKLYVIGSVLQQGQSQGNLGNSRMISYAAEGAQNPATLVVFANNTIVNEQSDINEGRAVIFLHENNGKTYSNDNVYFVNNVYQGYRLGNDAVPIVALSHASGGLTDRTAAFFTAANGNHIYNVSKAGDAAYAAANDPKFVDAANFDYRLQADSPLIDKGIEAVNVDEVELTPAFELNMDNVAKFGQAAKGSMVVTREIVGNAIDIGAFEYGNAGTAPVDPQPENPKPEEPDPEEPNPEEPNPDDEDATYDVSAYRSGGTYTAPTAPSGKIFAGWYTDSAFTQPLDKDVTTGRAYAKFVDEDVLGVKWQITAGTTTASAKTHLRLLTSVDTLMYSEVGFVVDAGDGKVRNPSTKTVYLRIIGYGENATHFYSPTIFSDASQYFMAYNFTNVPNRAFATEIKVTPRWTTLDGTLVTGKMATIVINSALRPGLIDGGEGTGESEDW